MEVRWIVLFPAPNAPFGGRGLVMTLKATIQCKVPHCIALHSCWHSPQHNETQISTQILSLCSSVLCSVTNIVNFFVLCTLNATQCMHHCIILLWTGLKKLKFNNLVPRLLQLVGRDLAGDMHASWAVLWISWKLASSPGSFIFSYAHMYQGSRGSQPPPPPSTGNNAIVLKGLQLPVGFWE